MNKRNACKINGFKYPAADQISGRTSTICRSMACTLLNRDACSPEDEKKWMEFFPEKKCAYCGKTATHLDHLHALIIDRKPTGYGTEPANLVPCCGDCNQPKGNLHWEEFMRSNNCHHVGDAQTADPQEAMEKRIENIRQFQTAMQPKKVVIDEETLNKWTEMLSDFDKMLKNVQDSLLEIKEQLYKQDSVTKGRIMKEKITDFYGERVYSKELGYGKLTKVYGEEIHIHYDKGGFYIYRSNAFENGTLLFVNPELLKSFNAIYQSYIHSEAGKFESYDTWFRRGS